MDGVLNDEETGEEAGDTKRLTDLHKRCMEDFRLAEDAWKQNRMLALEDIKFRAGDHWPEEIKAARSKIGKERPMLVVDKLNQYVRQIVNDARQNRPAVKVRPIDDTGDVEIANAFQGIIRHICDRSHADLAFDSSTEDAVVGGYGYYRVTTEYAHQNTFNQEICVERIGNPLSVMLGLPGEELGRARFGFIIDEMPKKEFKAKYPKAKYTDFDVDANRYTEGWQNGEFIRYCECFYVDEELETMHLLGDGTVVSEEDYQIAVTELGADKVPPITESREIPQPEVKWCRMSGAEILEENEWLGKWIPIIRVVGNEYNIEGKVEYSGLIRAAKDPQRLYNYSRSAFAERVALTPKSPWLVEEGQIEGYEDEWSAANTEPVVLKYKGTSLDGGHPVPPPQRVSATDIPEGFARDMSLSEHDIQASMGMYAASVGQQGNERSGKAIMARQREGDTATFHYQDNAARGVRFLGIILVDLIPKVYDSRRVMRILSEDGTSTIATHDPNQEKAVQKMGGNVIYNLSVGEYDVSVSAGPSYGTRRAEAAEAMMELVHNSPEVMTIAGDLLIKLQDWDGAQELAERFKLMLPPPIQQALAAKQDGLPPEAQAMMAQAHQAVQERDQQIQQMGQAIEEAQQSVKKLELQVQDKTDRTQVDLLKLQVDKFKAETDRMQAEAAAAKTPEDTSAFDNLRLQYEDKWKQLDADVRVVIAEMQSKTALTTASMSANAAGDGETTTSPSGEVAPSPAIAGLIAAVNANMTALTEGNRAVAEALHHVAHASKLPRIAKRDGQGNLMSVVVP